MFTLRSGVECHGWAGLHHRKSCYLPSSGNNPWDPIHCQAAGERRAYNDMSKCAKALCCQQWLCLGSQVSSRVYTLAVSKLHAGMRLEYTPAPSALVSSEMKALRHTGAFINTQLGLSLDNWRQPAPATMHSWRLAWVSFFSLKRKRLRKAQFSSDTNHDVFTVPDGA